MGKFGSSFQIEVAPETGLEEWVGVMGWHFHGKD